MKTLILSVILSGLFAACANGPCRTVKNPDLERQQANKQLPTATSIGALVASPSGVDVTGKEAKTTPAVKPTVFVYKADGSLQCGQGKAVSPEEMEKQLKGIKVHSRENRTDGLMHIQVCGSPTGKINVYEIDATSLKSAEKRGFKKLEPR